MKPSSASLWQRLRFWAAKELVRTTLSQGRVHCLFVSAQRVRGSFQVNRVPQCDGSCDQGESTSCSTAANRELSIVAGRLGALTELGIVCSVSCGWMVAHPSLTPNPS